MRHRLHVAMVLSRAAIAHVRDWWREMRHWERIR